MKRTFSQTDTRPSANESLAQSIAEEFVCPITHALPTDPVIAEDAIVYDRKAIQEWLAEHSTSPTTTHRIGKRLLPARAVKNSIRKLLDESVCLDRVILGDWPKYMAKEEKVLEHSKKAEAGSINSIRYLAEKYAKGNIYLKKDMHEAKRYALKGAMPPFRDSMCSYMYGKYETSFDTKVFWMQKSGHALGTVDASLLYAENGCVDEASLLLSDITETSLDSVVFTLKVAFCYDYLSKGEDDACKSAMARYARVEKDADEEHEIHLKDFAQKRMEVLRKGVNVKLEMGMLMQKIVSL